MTAQRIHSALSGRNARRDQQLKRLNETIARAKAGSEFYRERIDVDRLTSLDQITELPVTEKEEIRGCEGYPTIIRNREDILEYHTSSGTTSEPFVMALSREDVQRSKKVLSRTWRTHGVTNSDLVHMMAAYGLFTAGILNQYAIQEIGAGVVPSGIRSTEEQIKYIRKFEPDYLVAVSSYYLRLLEIADQRGVELPEFKGIIGGGVPVSERLSDHISREMGAPFYNQYGLAEINTAIAGECECHDGLHILSGYVYPEILDPDTLEPLGPGEEGVLTLTTLQRDAQVLVRYLTNDITSITYRPCDCGRNTPRIAPIKGRVDDWVFVRGAKLDLAYVQECIEEFDAYVDPFKWQLRIDREDGRDTLALYVNWHTDDARPGELHDHLSSGLGLTIDEVCDADTLGEDLLEHKLKRLVDLR